MRVHNSRSRQPTSWARGRSWSRQGQGCNVKVSKRYFFSFFSWQMNLDMRLSKVKEPCRWGKDVVGDDEVDKGELGARPPFSLATFGNDCVLVLSKLVFLTSILATQSSHCVKNRLWLGHLSYCSQPSGDGRLNILFSFRDRRKLAGANGTLLFSSAF